LVFFIDDYPFANWGHSCKYVFVNAQTGNIVVFNKTSPPDVSLMDVIIEQRMGGNLIYPQNFVEKSTSDNFCFSDNNKYAVIISGGYNSGNNWVRYWNDCAFMYSILVNKYKFDRNKIYVLMSDGTNPAEDLHLNNGTYISSPLDLDGDGTNDIQYSAKKANINIVFNALSNVVTNKDNVFIFTTDHGGEGSTLYLWGESMTTSEFETQVNKLDAAKSISVVMEQCYSGGFVQALMGNNRVITTACNANQPSWARSPDYNYNEFIYHWMSAVNGKNPEGNNVNADYNNDGIVTMNEAFLFASNSDA